MDTDERPAARMIAEKERLRHQQQRRSTKAIRTTGMTANRMDRIGRMRERQG
jgi:hypothetical protein